MLLTVGRLHRQKGIDVLIRAVADWAGPAHQPVLAVAGEGPERSALQQFAGELDVPLLLLGQRSDIADLLSAADVVVLPSRWEGSPLAAREALSAGRPLVATTVGGVPDLVDSSAARLVAPDDPGALGAAIAGLLADPTAAAALGEAGRRAAERWPDEAATTSTVLGIYTELLAAD
jgi:glycosyltransferase involved in cell wall biosynthesis